MRICFICNEYPPARHGGIGVFTRVLARALARAGHEVRVAGAGGPGAKAPAYEEDEGVRVWRLPWRAGRFGWLAARHSLMAMVLRWAVRGEVDLIEAPDYEGWVAGWPRLPVPVIVRLHGSVGYFAAEMGKPAGGGLFWMERAALERADFLCSVSRYTAVETRRLFRLAAADAAVLYNPIEIPPDANCPRAEGRVVFSGTLAEKKGIHSLMRAWPLVRKTCGKAELHVFGKDGRTEQGESQRAVLEAVLNGDGPSVYFHGHVPRETLFAALATARVAVFPSYAEAFAIAPLEAMAHGCPTIYSRRGSGPELIQDGVDGLLVDPEKPEEIALAIERVLTQPELAAALGEAGRCSATRRFSSGVLLRRNEKFYADCVDGFSR